MDTWRQRIKLAWKGWVIPIGAAILIATSFKSAIADWNIVPTGSMHPTIVEGDRILVNKLAYDLKVPYTTTRIAEWGDPQRGDIVVFYSPADHARLVKRVIGLPGDTIALRDNRIFINGKEQRYTSAKKPDQILEDGQVLVTEDLAGRRHEVALSPLLPSMRSFEATTVPKGCYFMMGDNRDNSFDSRYFGFVRREMIVGRASHIVASLDAGHNYQPRWQRFFSAMQ